MGESNRAHSIPLAILDDLGSRFIINVPEEERKNLIRICFQLELAHWFFIDEYVNSEANLQTRELKTCNSREFFDHMFRHIKFLRKHVNRLEDIMIEWREYKQRVPTYGAIILNENLTMVLLVQGFWSKSSWGFPKGKVNEDEAGHVCAIREVLEETGFDISPIIDPDDYIMNVINDQAISLYLIPGVPTNTHFAPRTKCEIKQIKWFPVDALPISKKEPMPENYLGISTGNLYMVLPFIRGLRKWIKRRRWKSQQGQHQHQQLKQHQQQQQQQQLVKQHQSLTAYTDASHKSQRDLSRAKNHKQQLQEPSNSQPDETVASPDFPDNFCPQSWSNFQVNKRDLFSAMASTPGWLV